MKDGLEASSDQPPNLLCSGRITDILPRLRLAVIKSMPVEFMWIEHGCQGTMGEAIRR